MRQDFTVLAIVAETIEMKFVVTMFNSIRVMQREVADVQRLCFVRLMADLIFFVMVEKVDRQNRKQEQSIEQECCSF